MAINNFISTVWSESLLRALDKACVGIANCSREYEGEIREQGNSVKICGLAPVKIGNYSKNSTLGAPEVLSDISKELVIDQAKYFNFQIDDIDRAQSSPRLMELAVQNAAKALADVADKHIYSFISEADNYVENTAPTVDNIFDTLIDARTMLLNQNVTDASDIVIEVSPEVAGLLLKAKLSLSTDNTDLMENGCIGNIGGCKVFVSSNIPLVEYDDGMAYTCLARTRRAIAFAEQLSEVEAYRPESRFADAMKGLHLYGAKVVYPREMVMIQIALPQT